MSHAIAICADYGYLRAATALIKSIAYHNHHEKIYLLNTDIPQEWFITVNHKLAPIDVKIIDTKFDGNILADKAVSRNYMNTMIYGRLLIPQLVKEDRVLYLDADTIVNGPIKDVFKIELGDKVIGAVEDFTVPGTFNSGVLLIDNARLRQQPTFTSDLLAKGQEYHASDDQTILNEYFKDQWLQLPNKYNFQIGLDQTEFYNETHNLEHYNQMLKQAKPRLVIHYSTADKPWNFTSSGRLREKWWQYMMLDYSQIVHRGMFPTIYPQPQVSLMTFTGSENLLHLEELLKAFPQYEFNVLAWTNMGSQLKVLSKYPNLRLYPNVVGANIDKVINKVDAYLDINDGPKEIQFMDRCLHLKKPVYSFASVKTQLDNSDQQYVVADDDVEDMIHQLATLSH